MNRIQTIICISALGIAGTLCSCGTKKNEDNATIFTEADSLTEIYLDLQDSILLSWNMMINDDNQKIKAMLDLLHELQVGGSFDPGELNSIKQRIVQLKNIRYTPKSMGNNEVVDEYDFASNSLVTELIVLAESHTAFSYNPVMQNLVEQIRTADQRIENYRAAYDAIVLQYNKFLTDHQGHLTETEIAGTLEKKPLFQMVSD